MMRRIPETKYSAVVGALGSKQRLGGDALLS
jgi:hypothetical protein